MSHFEFCEVYGAIVELGNPDHQLKVVVDVDEERKGLDRIHAFKHDTTRMLPLRDRLWYYARMNGWEKIAKYRKGYTWKAKPTFDFDRLRDPSRKDLPDVDLDFSNGPSVRARRGLGIARHLPRWLAEWDLASDRYLREESRLLTNQITGNATISFADARSHSGISGIQASQVIFDKSQIHISPPPNPTATVAMVDAFTFMRDLSNSLHDVILFDVKNQKVVEDVKSITIEQIQNKEIVAYKMKKESLLSQETFSLPPMDRDDFRQLYQGSPFSSEGRRQPSPSKTKRKKKK
jgi:hypothetical protein